MLSWWSCAARSPGADTAHPDVTDAAPSEARPGELVEAARLWWRKAPTERSLRNHERLWTAWTSATVALFGAPGLLLVLLEPLTFPVAALCVAHAWLIPMLFARRGARSIVPIGGERSAARGIDADPRAERVALGLLGDLVGHGQRELLARTGLVVERGRLGVWVIGERGALLVRPGGRRVDTWCVRIAEPESLPGGDLVAHLLLALREDEAGFAKVANMDFSGAAWRVRRRLPERVRPGLDAARRLAGSMERDSRRAPGRFLSRGA
jgi:hypothetical protein